MQIKDYTDKLLTKREWFDILSDLRVVFSNVTGDTKLDLVVNIIDGTWYTQITTWSVERGARVAIRRRVAFLGNKPSLDRWLEQW